MKIKQFKHYCQRLNLKPIVIRRLRENIFYLKGKGRYWRFYIDGDGIVLQASCINSEFDRWANSLYAMKCFNIEEFTFMKMKDFVLNLE